MTILTIIMMGLCIFLLVLSLYEKSQMDILHNDYSRTLDELDKFKKFYFLLIQIEFDYRNNAKLSDFFERNHYQTIAIYGLAEIGDLLYERLKNEGVEVKYFIDKKADVLTASVPVYLPECELPNVDIVVVTAIHNYEEVRNVLNKKGLKSVDVRDVACGV